MGEEVKIGCARPTGGPVGEAKQEQQPDQKSIKKEVSSMIKVGKKAPDFIAPAYHKGKFIQVKLSFPMCAVVLAVPSSWILISMIALKLTRWDLNLLFAAINYLMWEFRKS